MLQPDLERRMEERFSKVKAQVDKTRGSKSAYKEGESVLVQGLRPGDPKWLIGVVDRRCSAVTYLVRVGFENRFMHVDDLRPRYFECGEEGPTERPCFVSKLNSRPWVRSLSYEPPLPFRFICLPGLLLHRRSNPETQLPRNKQMQVHIKALPRQHPLCEYLCLH
ncbi:hypothetical protein MRX96_006998 [Rhipicephalus microplus]